MDRERDPRRERALRDHRRARVASLYIQGWYQADIATEVGVTQGTVSNDLKAVRQLWQRHAVADFAAKKAEELARIDELERTYWEAWTRSLASTKTTAKEHTSGARNQRKVSIREQEVVGDPRFLVGVQWCIGKRCDLLGLDAPRKIAPTSPDGTEEWSLGQYREELAKILGVSPDAIPHDQS